MGSGIGVRGLELRVKGLGFRGMGSGIGVKGLELRVEGLGFKMKVQDLG
jgi:hypothetical protein